MKFGVSKAERRRRQEEMEGWKPIIILGIKISLALLVISFLAMLITQFFPKFIDVVGYSMIVLAIIFLLALFSPLIIVALYAGWFQNPLLKPLLFILEFTKPILHKLGIETDEIFTMKNLSAVWSHGLVLAMSLLIPAVPIFYLVPIEKNFMGKSIALYAGYLLLIIWIIFFSLPLFTFLHIINYVSNLISEVLKDLLENVGYKFD